MKNTCDAVLNLIASQTKGLQLYWKGTPAYTLILYERWQSATSGISKIKSQNSSTG